MSSRAAGMMRTPDWTIERDSQRRIAAEEKQKVSIEISVVHRDKRNISMDYLGVETRRTNEKEPQKSGMQSLLQ